ncbi:MAG TPA: ROK family protein [Thermoclostridium sp.]|nr:ROK family protein [Thermoclostridium sp.]
MYYIGIDLGGTNIAAGIVDEEGSIIKKCSVPTGRPRASEEIVADMCSLVENLIKDAGINEAELHSIGIGSPGIPDRKNGVIIYNNNLGFRNVPIRELMQKRFNLPVYLENDANCAAIAECVAGAAKNEPYAVVITIGTGIGGGVIIDNKLYTGFNGAGGELGHVVIHMGGEDCTCGRKGCWEAYSSATALIRQTIQAAAENPKSIINRLAEENSGRITAKTAFDAARLGDETAIKVVDQYIEMLAEGLANMINIFQPNVVVLGGGVSKEGENLLAPLREKVRGKSYGAHGVENTRIVAAQLGNDAGIVGAALISKV